MSDYDYDDKYKNVITLGVDGNCAYALRGTTFEHGDAEFVEITKDVKRWSDPWLEHVRRLAIKAGRVLACRLGVSMAFCWDDNLRPLD